MRCNKNKGFQVALSSRLHLVAVDVIYMVELLPIVIAVFFV